MDGITTRHTLVQRVWHRLLDGDAPWGAYDVWPDRFGTTRFRLTVYPPGISARERRILRVWRGWPAWGGLLLAVGVIVFAAVLPPWIALAVGATLFVGSGVAAFVMVGDARRRVRTRIATVTVGYYHPAAAREARHLKGFAQRLATADIERRDGTLTAVAYEATWWQVYNELTADEQDNAARTPAGE